MSRALPWLPAVVLASSLFACTGGFDPSHSEWFVQGIVSRDFGRPLNPSTGTELYATGSGLSRYPMNSFKVLPSPNAVLSIPALHIAVASDGTTYVSNGGSTMCGSPWISVYAPFWTSASRPLYMLDTTGLNCVSSMTSDSNGNVYVVAIDGASTGVFVYPPGGKTRIQSIIAPMPNSIMMFEGAVLASNGNLYVSSRDGKNVNAPGTIFTYSNPLTNPTITSQFSDKNLLLPTQIAASDTELYILEHGAPRRHKRLGIHVYPISASGIVSPTRTIGAAQAGGEHDILGFDLFKDHIYLGNGTQLAVLDALHGGKPPLQLLDLDELPNGAAFLRVGP
jgi:hypothetical protein